MRGRSLACLTTAATLAAAAPAPAQEPVQPMDLPSPGSVVVEGELVVTRGETVRVKLLCVEGDVACTGTLRVRTVAPVSPGKGKARRVVTVTDSSFGEFAPGEIRTIELPLAKQARHRVRAYRTTRVEWHAYGLDGRRHYVFVPHRTTLTSRVAVTA